MAIFLDDQTRTYLERKFKDIKETDFIGKRIQKMLQADRERLDVLARCEHQRVEFTGNKNCCGKCGSLYETGMGEEWSRK